MDRRTLLAVVLVAIVIVGTPLLFPSARPTKHIPIGPANDTTPVAESLVVAHGQPVPSKEKVAVPMQSGRQIVAETTVVATKFSRLVLSSQGSQLSHVQLANYRALDNKTGKNVDLQAGATAALLGYTVSMGKDSLILDTTNFEKTQATIRGNEIVTYTATVDGYLISVVYTIPADTADRYLLHVTVAISNAPPSTTLHVSLPTTLVSTEADTLTDIRLLAVAWKPNQNNVESVGFAKLDSGTTKVVPGSLDWVAVRNKYFLTAILAPHAGISALVITGQPRSGKNAKYASSIAILPLIKDTAAFDIYAGPQDFDRLHALGRDLDQVNPASGLTHSVVQPFATIMIRVLLWFKRTTGMSYGLVIIIFGITIRVALWPLNQKAMRTSIRMQRIQPELTETQQRYKNDPEKQRDALMKLYQAHGMTPLSPMMGCLPLLLPMPILLALYYVFQNTIEFRGVGFLWMPDISAADPYFIMPLLMGVSMFALSWIGMRGVPPTPQTRMMSYMMPVVMMVMFFRFAAGLNLYYAVQNLAALPQQWMLSKERQSAGGGIIRTGPVGPAGPIA